MAALVTVVFIGVAPDYTVWVPRAEMETPHIKYIAFHKPRKAANA